MTINQTLFCRETAIERPLGASEDMFWRFDSVSPINFGVVMRLKGRCTNEQVKFALQAIQQRHPLMRARIEADENGIPWFRSEVGQVPLQESQQAAGQEWQLLENELNTPFDAQIGPLLRCILVRHDDDDLSLVMVYHHAASDGKSAFYVARDLVQSISQQQQGETWQLPALEPVGYYGDRINTLKDYDDLEDALKTIWKTLRTSAKFVANAGVPSGLRKENEIPLDQQRVIVEPRFVEAADMKLLLARAKQEGTTMQCVLNTALSLTVARDSPTSGIEVTGCTQVIDVRDRLHPPVGEDCGVFAAAGATSLHSISMDTDFWTLARSVSKRLKETMATPLPFFHPALHRSYSLLGKLMGNKNMASFGKVIKRLHPEGLAVSNIGRLVFDIEGTAVEVADFGFATNTNVFNYFNTSAATLNGRLTWSFSGSTMLGRERIASVADNTVACMMQALKE
ncbi:MAG: condensation domain-containing protein [Pseudomonadales bacterium]|nr:condensation domain-containing protein [Pseudomonadales bacterium]